MLYVFEIANNHQGSLAHAKKIIDEVAQVAKDLKVSAAIKLQFRQLDTFIHKSFKTSDLKFVKRFNSTRLSKEEFREILEHVKKSGLITMATPFDNESLPWLEELEVSVVKIASCSIDDWPLLEEVCKINKKIIISTAGASIQTLKKVHSLFKHHQRDFAFMHCVGEYPTPVEHSDLNRITLLKKEFPDIEIGFSTHESPLDVSMAPVAVAMGCTIVEKHVGCPTNEIALNGYSNTPSQMANVIKQIERVREALCGTSPKQKESLGALKRGVYVNKKIPKGHVLQREDLYYAMPCQHDQHNASSVRSIIGSVATTSLEKDAPVAQNQVAPKLNTTIIETIKEDVLSLLSDARVPLSGKESVELSAHYGLYKFREQGALIIDKINRAYCKKIIVMLAGQEHPIHRHIKKEEAFELLHGDCSLNLNGKTINLEKGKPVLIARGVNHSFKSNHGCVIEEISTTHIRGDSIYQDVNINTLPLPSRKIKIKLIEK